MILEVEVPQKMRLTTYLRTDAAIWYWVTIAAGTIAAALAFTISENIYPWVHTKQVTGVLFILFLPGYSFTKALFQTNISSKSIGSLNVIERIALSIGMSIALVSLVGLLLYYSPWGLDLTTIVLSLFVLTSVLATAAVVREYRARKD